MAAPLKEAGLHRINVSLDTLKAERFERITRGGSFEAAGVAWCRGKIRADADQN